MSRVKPEGTSAGPAGLNWENWKSSGHEKLKKVFTDGRKPQAGSV